MRKSILLAVATVSFLTACGGTPAASPPPAASSAPADNTADLCAELTEFMSVPREAGPEGAQAKLEFFTQLAEKATDKKVQEIFTNQAGIFEQIVGGDLDDDLLEKSRAGDAAVDGICP